MEKTEISVVIPACNEEESVILLYNELKKNLDKLNKSYELIFIDDGSKDNTFKQLKIIKVKDDRLKIIKFRKNFGQTAALDAGFRLAKGNIIISLDSDLQDNPDEIPRFLNKINEGFDVVCGWRIKRNDSLSKKLFSRIANLVRFVILGRGVNDSGCTFRAYRNYAIKDINLFGEMHRYIPYLLIWKGFKISEIKVIHRARKFGKSKYGIKRLIKGFLDMLVVKFWMQYSIRPVHLFGALGLLITFLGFIIGFYLLVMKFFYAQSIANRPLLLLSILLIILGIQFLIFGLLFDILIKDYYKDKRYYNVEAIIE